MSTERRRPHYNVTFALLAAGAVAYALLQSMVAPALLEIQHDLGTTTSGVAWVLTAYLLECVGDRRRSPAGSATCSARSACS